MIEIRTSNHDDDICAYFRSQGGQCVRSNLGQHLHWCTKCQSLVVQRGHGLACNNRCLQVHMDFGIRGEKASPENGFNPVVARLCGSCCGEGFLYTKKENETVWNAAKCSPCSGSGWITGLAYEETNPGTVLLDASGWTRCPKCNFRFKASDPNVMIGDRHKRCGQRVVFKHDDGNASSP